MHTLPNDPHLTNAVQRDSLLQEGVSCALATLHAIEGGDLFRALPADEAEQTTHNHGLWLLAMLNDHLIRIQQKIDAMDALALAGAREG